MANQYTWIACCRNCSSHVRTKDQIEATGAYDRDQFVPAPQTKFSQLAPQVLPIHVLAEFSINQLVCQQI